MAGRSAAAVGPSRRCAGAARCTRVATPSTSKAGQVFEGAPCEGGDGGFEIGVRGDDDHRQLQLGGVHPLISSSR